MSGNSAAKALRKPRLDPVSSDSPGSTSLGRPASTPNLGRPEAIVTEAERTDSPNDQGPLPQLKSPNESTQSRSAWGPEAKGTRWQRNVGNRWPSVHKADASPCAPGRVRTLICNWPTHFCKDSLIMIPAGSEPIGAPYKLVACCDLRKRKDELQKKSVYLVAYDAERLRTYGTGIGIDALEASNSFLAKDCICSDIVPIKSWYGEVQLTLHPPDNADGDVLVLLRVVKTSNLKDMQDWHPIGDAVVVKVEPRITREDKAMVQRWRQELDISRELVNTMREVLEQSMTQHKACLVERAELEPAITKAQLQLKDSQDDVSTLHADLEKVTAELGEPAAKSVQAALDGSKKRQSEASSKVSSETQKELGKAQREFEKQQSDIDDGMASLALKIQEAKFMSEVARNKTADEQAAELARQQKRELEKSLKDAKGLQRALDKASEDKAEAKAETAAKEASLKTALDEAKTEAEQNKAEADQNASTAAQNRSEADQHRTDAEQQKAVLVVAQQQLVEANKKKADLEEDKRKQAASIEDAKKKHAELEEANRNQAADLEAAVKSKEAMEAAKVAAEFGAAASAKEAAAAREEAAAATAAAGAAAAKEEAAATAAAAKEEAAKDEAAKKAAAAAAAAAAAQPATEASAAPPAAAGTDVRKKAKSDLINAAKNGTLKDSKGKPKAAAAPGSAEEPEAAAAEAGAAAAPSSAEEAPVAAEAEAAAEASSAVAAPVAADAPSNEA